MNRPAFLISVILALGLGYGLAFTSPSGPAALGTPAVSDDDCLTCHGDPELNRADGTSLYFDQDKAQGSSHGQAGLSCVDCHTDLKATTDFPHAEKLRPVVCAACHEDIYQEIKASVHDGLEKKQVPVGCKDCHGTHDIRPADDFESSVSPLNLPETCEKCHAEKVKTPRGGEFIRQYEASAHFQGLMKSGLTLSANCSHCHGVHDILPTKDPASRVARSNIIRTCGRCHVGIEKSYREGVHGKAYVKGSGDVPVCTDCHSEHDIRAPEDLGSRVYATKVAAICVRCHDDERLGRLYGFLTSRLKTYFGSYHGTASKFGETRVANCASCHGFHDIRDSSDPDSSINPANLPKTCGTCHTGAGANFAKGKIHETPAEMSGNRWAQAVKVFYIALIAVLISAFLLFIAADLFRKVRLKWLNKRRPR
ncbi:MAG: cytochrome c3 family protein [Candidatus Aminicenantes bacterium]|nr:cytochrome c3 family protein [Candidatus Aminicenantes bacterium]